jgi:hypothetical protein
LDALQLFVHKRARTPDGVKFVSKFLRGVNPLGIRHLHPVLFGFRSLAAEFQCALCISGRGVGGSIRLHLLQDVEGFWGPLKLLL